MADLHKGTWAWDGGPRNKDWMGMPHCGEHSLGTRDMLSKSDEKDNMGPLAPHRNNHQDSHSRCSYQSQLGLHRMAYNKLLTTTSKTSHLPPLQGGKLRLGELVTQQSSDTGIGVIWPGAVKHCPPHLITLCLNPPEVWSFQ